MRIGQVRTYCQCALGFGLPPLMIAARGERNGKTGAGFRIAAIERDRAPRRRFGRACASAGWRV